jgi:hypothetical protein
MKKKALLESDLYEPVKTLLEKQGYEVKGEIGAVDIVAMRGDEDPVIVELKTGFSLSLFHQAITRQSMTDAVYIAVPRGKGKPFLRALKNNISLCRRLGLGLITVRLKDKLTEIHIDPCPYKPRISKKRKSRLLREFARRVGDPNKGGSTRQGLITSYRQDSLRIIVFLQKSDPLKASIIAKETDVSKARIIMSDNHYGWFERVERGIYTITPKGINALKTYAPEIKEMLKNLKSKPNQ